MGRPPVFDGVLTAAWAAEAAEGQRAAHHHVPGIDSDSEDDGAVLASSAGNLSLRRKSGASSEPTAKKQRREAAADCRRGVEQPNFLMYACSAQPVRPPNSHSSSAGREPLFWGSRGGCNNKDIMAARRLPVAA